MDRDDLIMFQVENFRLFFSSLVSLNSPLNSHAFTTGDIYCHLHLKHLVNFRKRPIFCFWDKEENENPSEEEIEK